MKVLIIFSFLFSFSLSATGVAAEPAAPCTHCGVELKRTSVEALPGDLRKNAGAMPSRKIGLLAEGICGALIDGGTDIAKKVKKDILKHMRIYEGIFAPTNGQIIKFLNRNKSFMTCDEGDVKKHYMKVAFDHGRSYDQLFNMFFFDEILSGDEIESIDVNAISINSRGKPETVLDYMYEQYTDITNSQQVRDEIKSLIETFEEFLGAKRYANLDKAAQDNL